MVSTIHAFWMARFPPFPPVQKPTARPLPTVGYEYDSDGNLYQLIYPDGTVVDYTYTSRNQLYQVSNAGPPPVATYEYNIASIEA